ncbi:MAG: Asp-tRNA(Asn)/Glu-tRNA(Gln) amidotransferase subunit GatC [candidate division Zixibacteria bacterium]|nr:Asp-tRNA(Asn)/Glu-tRNA(Gln) amidotransferase subunit GatC [candidate division Zixibacteria bacterium]MBU1472056.1 Asp-tRNA(Asn)/Glu-tRNA(Gln) amidotransferase subunit GatC [candidate division Zixibacteria bacterium]
MAVSSEEIRHIAELAKLKLTPEEIARFQVDLSAILDYVDQLRQVDTTGVTVSGTSAQIENVFREDTVENSLPIDKALENAPEVKNGMFSVPKVIDS